MFVPQFTTKEIESEEWRDVISYESLYQVSNLGRVRRLANSPKCKTTRILKLQFNENGYLVIMLCKASRVKLHQVHQIVAEAFIGPAPEGKEVNHLDHNRANPRLENLEYCTHKQNAQYAAKCGRYHKYPRRKLTSSDVLAIRQMLIEGNSIPTVAERFNVSKGAITGIKGGWNWKHLPLPTSP